MISQIVRVLDGFFKLVIEFHTRIRSENVKFTLHFSRFAAFYLQFFTPLHPLVPQDLVFFLSLILNSFVGISSPDDIIMDSFALYIRKLSFQIKEKIKKSSIFLLKAFYKLC